jgi:hypothetical protein
MVQELALLTSEEPLKVLLEVNSGHKVPLLARGRNKKQSVRLYGRDGIGFRVLYPDAMDKDMASIDLQPDNISSSVWWLKWVEADEIVGLIVQDGSGRCQIEPRGPRWSPMKSFGGRLFDTREAARAEVAQYFRGR